MTLLRSTKCCKLYNFLFPVMNLILLGDFNEGKSYTTNAAIEFFKIGTIRKMYKVGLNSIEKIILLDSIDIFLKAEGIKSKSANKILKSIKD